MTKRLNPGAPGAAFKRCVAAVEARGGAYSPRGVCATAGRKKYGKKRFAEMAAAGKRRAKRRNPEFHLQYLGIHGDWLHARNVFVANLAEARRAFKEDIAFYEGGGSKTRVVPATRANISDRALRYRANVEPPPGPKQCAFCGSKKQVQVGHVNGREQDSSPENLIWTCRSCNVLAGNTLRKAGIGRLTVQYNPADGAKSVGQWLQAVGAIIPHEYPERNYGLRGASTMTTREAVAMIRATSPRKRSEFAAKLKRHNPAAAATEAFEEFHGHRPDETVTVSKQLHFHKHLAGAGKLVSLTVKPVSPGLPARTLKGFKGAILAFNEEKSQLFIEGGDQGLDRAELRKFGISEPHELETLGKVVALDYHTDKSHLGSEGGKAVYAHRFRTTNQDGQHVTVTVARYPDLIYRVLDEQLEFSGGSYTIKREGIDR